jgi:hypothetical protein
VDPAVAGDAEREIHLGPDLDVLVRGDEEPTLRDVLRHADEEVVIARGVDLDAQRDARLTTLIDRPGPVRREGGAGGATLLDGAGFGAGDGPLGEELKGHGCSWTRSFC